MKTFSDPKLRFYGRRKGRTLSCKRKNFMGQALQELLKDPHDFIKQNAFQNIFLEIGFGTGQHALTFLKNHPLDAFIGVEAFEQGVASFISNLEKEDYQRVCLFHDNVHLFLPLLPKEFLAGIFVLFPDPWPKKNHIQRRIVQQNFLNQCAEILKPHGCMYLATDIFDLHTFMHHELSQNSKFEMSAFFEAKTLEDFEKSGLKIYPSKYAEKGLMQGRSCYLMAWKKK